MKLILVSVALMILIAPAFVLSSDLAEATSTGVSEGVVDQAGTSASDVMDWLLQNIEALVAGAVIILTGLGVIAKLTKNPEDDKWVAKLLAFFKLWPQKKE